MNAAIVIGVDDYAPGAPRLGAAVRDAERFFAWVVSRAGGNVPRRYARLLLARRPDDPPPDDPGKQANAAATKDNVVTAINELVTASEAAESGPWDRLYFYFSGHGITARVANRDEAALVTPGFDALHPDHSLAIRSLIEFFETTRFRDQFFFLDACRDDPWQDREYEIGRWPIPRRRNPGEPPVQQFILHAVPSGAKAQEALEWWPGEGVGEFSDVLMAGLRGDGEAKAWSWERSRYEVRWERLAGYVKAKMEAKKLRPRVAGRTRPDGGWPIQVPQDTGSRGVAGRDRDALLVAFPRSRRFRPVKLTVELKGGRRNAAADVSVRDAAGEPVTSALKVPGTSHEFTLPPKTYAVSAESKGRRGRVKWPIELYEAKTEPIELEAEPKTGAQAIDSLPRGAGTGRIAVEPPDPLTVTELRDEAGTLSSDAGVPVKMGDARFRVPAGFYRVRLLGPEPEAMTEEQRIILRAGEPENVRMQDFTFPRASARAIRLARDAGGEYDSDDHSVRLASEKLQWAQPSTIVAVALGEGLASARGGLLRKLELQAPRSVVGGDSGIALYAVPGQGPATALRGLSVRQWESGAVVPEESTRLEAKSGVAGFVARVEKPGGRWLAIERDGAAVVIALPVLAGRLATVIAQVEPGQLKLYQHHPAIGGGPSATARAVRRAEHLQRMILGGRLDAAQALATELAKSAREDPFAGCLAGYALLRFGIDDRERAALLATAIDAVIEVAPTLSDGYVLRAQYEAAAGNTDAAAQAFADAVNVGVPAFGEGLTRLIEGLRATSFLHPRGALIRHVFQRHARGTMWSAFTPVRTLEPGRLVISGADLGFEG